MKSEISPMFLTYHMVKWQDVEQHPSDQKCQTCGQPLKLTEDVVSTGGARYVGYVCHADKRVTWVKVG